MVSRYDRGMILDSSAVVAIVCGETGYLELLDQIADAETLGIGAPTVFETAMVLTIKLRRDGLAVVNEFLRESGAQVISFTDEHASIAFGAYFRYGKGRHKAALNLGDCLSYSVAKVSGQALLFIGNDFTKTDVAAA
jgi:ribonuclease VapC